MKKKEIRVRCVPFVLPHHPLRGVPTYVHARTRMGKNDAHKDTKKSYHYTTTAIIRFNIYFYIYIYYYVHTAVAATVIVVGTGYFSIT